MRREWREWRWLEVGPDFVRYRAETATGRERLRREASWHAALEREGVPVARLLSQDDDQVTYERVTGLAGAAEIETRVFGGPPPADRYAASISVWGEGFAAALGRTLARVHRADATMLEHFESLDWDAIRSAIEREAVGVQPHIVDALERWETSLEPGVSGTHADPHFGNLVVSEDGSLLALFDFDESCRAPRGLDLAYLDSEGPDFTSAALEAYADEAGEGPSRTEVFRFHLRSALCHLGEFDPDHERMPGICRWVEQALVSPVGRRAVDEL